MGCKPWSKYGTADWHVTNRAALIAHRAISRSFATYSVAVRFARDVCAAGLCVAYLVSCGSSHPPVPHSPTLAHTQQVKAIAPRLTTIERVGDPSGALGVVIAHRLGRAAAEQLVVAVKQSYPSAAAVQVVGGTLFTFVDENKRDWAELLKFFRRLQPLAPGSGSRANGPDHFLDDCSPDAPSETMRQLAQRLGTQRLGLGAVGDATFLKRVRTAIDGSGAWATGVAVNEPAQRGAAVAVESNTQQRLRVALKYPDFSMASGQAARLRNSTGLLRSIAGRTTPGWSLQSAHASVKSFGACLQTTWTPTTSASGKDAGRLAQFLQHALATEADEGVSALARAAAQPSAASAAARLAWLSLAKPGPTAEAPALLSVTFEGGQELNQLRAGIAAKTTAMQRHIVSERGQGRIHVLLQSSCPTRDETTEHSGHVALTLTTAALQAQRAVVATDAHQSVRVQPWFSNRAAGILASVDVSQPRAERALVERLLVGLLADKSGLALQQAAERFQGNASSERELFDFGRRLLNNGRPTWTSPPLEQQSPATLTERSAERALRSFLGGPLSLFVSHPTSVRAAQQLSDEIHAGLAPLRQSPAGCGGAGAAPLLVGDFAHSAATERQTLAVIPVPKPHSASAGSVVPLLRQRLRSLERTTSIHANLTWHAPLHPRARGGLFLDLRSTPKHQSVGVETKRYPSTVSSTGGFGASRTPVDRTSLTRLEAREARLRFLNTALNAFSRPLTDAESARLSQAEPRSGDPATRLAQLPTPKPKPQQVQRFLGQTFNTERLIIVHAPPR